MKIWSIILVALLVLMLGSCNQPPIDAVSESPVAPISTTEPIAINGFQLDENGVKLVVPGCMGSGAVSVVEPEKNEGESAAYYASTPSYRHVTIEGYLVENSSWTPSISIYPVTRYNELVAGNLVADDLARMQQINSDQKLPDDGIIPFLPYSGAENSFIARPSLTSFQNGKGVGYLTQISQSPSAINNYDLIYTFQGITNDGEYWVAVTLPINMPFLQSSAEDSTIPDGGIEMPDDSAMISSYYSAIRVKMNSVDGKDFSPTPQCIYELIASIEINRN